ncbi:TlpA family protein disulfide reductase [Gracilinema caldarium]|uniref:Alkyl hydroperoxide reductase/ Thiol specific antioxidant/ Mal allergen n=1 Tax=Gracilinema caldarium (strain ATCC 51460 / DSM 7334 / H1) TaxID=744872 RepID=F8F0M7_GRAC1|nr:TlpA disulfide reductase family protein [Gracilinema caldarium]AEJ19734.1 alkyl hydroperoxide reductase/ Thiol specific antioxidant/ Mal allergen [Gracilinema caldarium DSM 7334]
MRHYRTTFFTVSLLFFFLLAATFATEGPKLSGANESHTWKKALQDIGFTVFPEAQTLPVLNVPGLDSKYINIKDFSGSYVLLNFWATWCPPCKAEMPSMETFYKTFKDKKLTIFAISTGEKPDTVKAFIKANPHSFPIGLDVSGQLGAIFASRGIPTTYIINPEGKAIAGTIGGRDWMDKKTVEAFAILLSSNRTN